MQVHRGKRGEFPRPPQALAEIILKSRKWQIPRDDANLTIFDILANALEQSKSLRGFRRR